MAKRIFSTHVSRTLTISLLCALALGGAIWAVATFAASPPSLRTVSAHGGVNNVASRNLASFADVVDAVKPTVFAVEARLASDATQDLQEQDRDDVASDVPPPSNDAPPRPAIPNDTPDAPAPLPKRRLLTSQGSGFFISPDGYAVTNSHVVENAESTQILTDDQKTYAAKVVGPTPSATWPCSRSTVATISRS
jgi:serine protease Do